MLQAEQLSVAEVEQDSTGTFHRELAQRYETAEEIDLREFTKQYSFPKFISAVLDRLGKDFDHEAARVVDEIDDPEDVHFGMLLTFPDESVMFVGSDPTAKDSIPWFCFTIERHEPRPAPETAQDALDMLKPASVRDVEHEDNFLPDRHGEWWLLPVNLVPAGSVFKPGVGSKPYGPSPLGNHVPTEYAFTARDSVFMDKFRENVPSAPKTITTPEEVIEWSWRQVRKSDPPEDAPDWADIRSWAGDVLVRKTIRHRENDHFVEGLGEVWHKAETHDVRVYTGDEIATDIHLDYHGRMERL